MRRRVQSNGLSHETAALRGRLLTPQGVTLSAYKIKRSMAQNFVS
ncbi:MAG: hypothetical protein ACR2HG_09390 [Pyrinomonadaceae bacterium]